MIKVPPMLKALALTIVTALVSLPASASLILETYSSGSANPNTIGGYAMTDFNLIAGNAGDAISSISSPISGSVGLSDQYGNPVSLGFADSTTWWVNGEANDSNIFTTGTNTITIVLPENTLAFAFNVGANQNAQGWIDTFETNGSGLSGNSRHYFSPSASNTPGFGVYADSSQECSYLSSIVIDPTFIWGAGNFSINQGSCNTAVPEPSPIILLGLGLVGLVIIRRKNS
tara:strand:+ start:42975 stop:43664 length:690 start_codon:yes stop_codon:yes gene_type:complete